MLKQEMGRSKVALIASKSYGKETEVAVKQADELIGGIKDVVRPEDVVLIKPNLVNSYDAESGNVTHFSLIKPLIEACHLCGASRIFVGDGSADVDTAAAFTTSGIEKVIGQVRQNGIQAELVDLNYDRNPKTNEFETVNLGRDGLYPNYTYRVAYTVLNADVIISVPKLKAHPLTGMSCALKNMMGIAPGGYYGFPKRRSDALPHGTFKNSLHNDVIWRIILDLNRIALGKYVGSSKERKYMVIVDGVVAGAYDKALDLGDPYWMAVWKPVKVGAIIAGFDPVAVDTVSARLMCYRPEKIPTIVHASDVGLGTMNNIEIIGERIEDMRIFVPQSKGFLSIADLHMPKLWPKAFYCAFKTNTSEWINSKKPSIYGFLQKHGLCY